MDQEFERNIISLTDEEGKDYELEVLAAVTYNDAEYLALAPVDIDDEEDELEVSILKSVTEGDETVLCTVTDEGELEAVYDLLMEEMFELDVEGEEEEDF